MCFLFNLGIRDVVSGFWISGYLDIQAFLAIHYPDSKKVEISKYPSIQVSMISKYPCIQVSGYIKNEISNYPYIQTLDSWIVSISKYPNSSIRILGYLDYFHLWLNLTTYGPLLRIDFINVAEISFFCPIVMHFYLLNQRKIFPQVLVFKFLNNYRPPIFWTKFGKFHSS